MKISLVRLTTKNLATLALRVIEASKTGKTQLGQQHPMLMDLEEGTAPRVNLIRIE